MRIVLKEKDSFDRYVVETSKQGCIISSSSNKSLAKYFDEVTINIVTEFFSRLKTKPNYTLLVEEN